jgi:hypothetical protein
MDTIVDLTIDYYKQEAVLATKLSDEFILRNKKDKGKNEE